MPESTRDRPTNSYEHVFLLTKSARYWYDANAVREDSTGQQGAAAEFYRATGNRVGRTLNGIPTGNEAHYTGREDNGHRNLRNVWTIATHAYSQCHFATFPPELAERCIKAGTSEKGCCGAMVPKLQLRSDLTEAQRAKVYARLGARGLA